MIETRFSEETGILIGKNEVYSVSEKRNVVRWGHFEMDRTRRGVPTHVGPWYKTKAELMTDHEDYLRRAGWLKQIA